MRHTFSAMWSDDLGRAIAANAPSRYRMELVGEDLVACQQAVNQGIDAYLEACFVPTRGDSYEDRGGRLACLVSRESLPCLVRRLLEGDDAGMSLASGICSTIDIELV